MNNFQSLFIAQKNQQITYKLFLLPADNFQRFITPRMDGNG